jgi:hypothetical protein
MAQAETGTYGVRYRIEKRNGTVEVKERLFSTEKARDRFVAALETKDGFMGIDAWLDEKASPEVSL